MMAASNRLLAKTQIHARLFRRGSSRLKGGCRQDCLPHNLRARF
jgi:hypothetical protein